MKEVKAAICDDEPMPLNMVASALKSCFAQQGVELKLDRFTSAVQLAKKIPGNVWQLLFLDIDMPEMDGIELGKKLKSEHENTVIIYISNCENRVFDAFAAHPFGFVRKSSFLKDVQSVTELYIAEVLQKDIAEESLEIRTHGGIMRLNIQDILYIECEKDYQMFHMTGRADTVRVQQRMNILEEKLKQYGFLRVHAGYLVNYRYIRRIGEAELQLQNAVAVPISRRRKKEILLDYMRLSRENRLV